MQELKSSRFFFVFFLVFVRVTPWETGERAARRYPLRRPPPPGSRRTGPRLHQSRVSPPPSGTPPRARIIKVTAQLYRPHEFLIPALNHQADAAETMLIALFRPCPQMRRETRALFKKLVIITQVDVCNQGKIVRFVPGGTFLNNLPVFCLF